MQNILKNNNARGITLLELLVVLGVLAIVATLLTGALAEFRTTSALAEAKSEIIGILRDARSRTIASRNNMQYGVHFDLAENIVALFEGDTYNAGKLRYHRIILMNDADVDGEHITTLALTFFFRHMPDIIQGGYLYIAMPPLYRIEADKKEYYVYTDTERDAKLAELKDRKTTLQRYKGLGEMNPEQLWMTTMNPAKRMLKQVHIEEAEAADEIFSILMGDDVAPRKKFIQINAHQASLDV
ncbi:MAG: gyrase subunit B protein [Microgenomates group bacterium GW2011_GWA1_46_7]|nr:MAG: gyrase subunit B protein [Microgenomates group bacterium GW2011_GWA1_46_7]